MAAFKDSTEVWLRQGETFPVEDLIYAMMIQSANDAAYALAHKAGGTVSAFVALMNIKARELGMNSSTFHARRPRLPAAKPQDIRGRPDDPARLRAPLPLPPAAHGHPQVHLPEDLDIRG